MIALAWCSPSAAPPPPLMLLPCGRLAVLCAPSGDAARDRLALLQQAFDAGHDFVPLAAGHIWSTAEACATALARENDLCVQLAGISGQGQATLSLTWRGPVAPVMDKQSGRDWMQMLLLHRREVQARAAQGAEVLLALTEAHTGPRGPVTATTTGLRQSLLMPRAGLADLYRHIKARSKAHNGFSLRVTGLWPAFDFVHMPLCHAKATS